MRTQKSGVAVYLSLNHAETRKRVLWSAATASLYDKPEILGGFEICLKALEAVRRRRNEFAHGLWGWSPHLEDALLWTTQDDALHTERLLRTDVASDAGGMWAKLIDRVFVYRKDDLDADFSNAQDGYNAVYTLQNLVRTGDSVYLANLLALPLIAKLTSNPG